LLRLRRRLLSLQIGWAVLLAVAPLAALGMTIRNEDLAARQQMLQRAIVLPNLNAMLYDFDKRQGIRAGIVTDYLAAPWLPGLERRFIMCPPENAAAFREIYRRPEIGLALLHQKRTPPETWQYLEASGEGKSRLIAQTPMYRLYEKISAEGDASTFHEKISTEGDASTFHEEISAVADSPISGECRSATAPGKESEDRRWTSRR
jgi:hypothetical protein